MSSSRTSAMNVASPGRPVSGASDLIGEDQGHRHPSLGECAHLNVKVLEGGGHSGVADEAVGLTRIWPVVSFLRQRGLG